MTEKKKTPKTATAATTSKQEEPKFPVNEILGNAEAFEVSAYIVAGALHGKGQDFSKSEVRKNINEFLRQEVK